MDARPDAPGVDVRFPLFDSLRAIAALSVFVVHQPLVVHMSVHNPLRRFLIHGQIGVAVFFLISGFLLYRPFARARLARTAGPAIGAYGIRRALRIAPAYWVALAFTVLLVGASGEAAKAVRVFSPHGVVAYFGFLQVYDSRTLLGGISAAWSLCVEVGFYALLPVWALALRRIAFRSRAGFLRTELAGLAALFVAGVAWTAFGAVRSVPHANLFLDVTSFKLWLWVLPAYLDHFALGMGLAVVSVWAVERSRPPAAVRFVGRAPAVPWVLAFVTFLAIGQLPFWVSRSWALDYVITHVLEGLFALLLLLPAVFGDPRRGAVRRLLGSRVLLWIGLVSYGVYLWHVAILRRLSADLPGLGDGGLLVVGLVLTLAAAAASFYVVERPALRLSRRLSARRRSQDADFRMRDLPRHEREQVPAT